MLQVFLRDGSIVIGVYVTGMQNTCGQYTTVDVD